MAKKKASGSMAKAKALVKRTPHIRANKILADTAGKGSLTEKVQKARVRVGKSAEQKWAKKRTKKK